MSEEEQTLEEKIKSLRQQGRSSEEAVREIFRENLDADVNEICRITGLEKLQVGRIKGQVSRWLKRRKKEAPAEKGAPPETLYKTEPDVNSILEEILDTHPDIPAKVKDEVLDWAKRRGTLDPGFVAWLLSSMRGISSTTAHVVSQKYALAIQRAQMEGKIQLPSGYPLYPAQPSPAPQWGFSQAFPTGFPPSMPGMPSSVPGAPQYGVQPGASQYGTTPPPPYGMFPSWQPPQPQDVRSVVREELRASEERKPKEVAEAYVDIEEPIRLPDGRVVIGEDERPIMRRLHIPASQASQLVAPTQDPETRFLEKMKLYREVFGKEELTEAKIRQIIKEEQPPAAPTSPEKSVTLEDVQKASTEAAKSAVKDVVEAYEKEDKEERRHKEVLTAIRESGSTKAVEGYRDDSYRILGHGLSETAGAIRERKPLEVVIKDGGRILFGGPPEKEVEAGAGEGLLKRLKERGWVVEQ